MILLAPGVPEQQRDEGDRRQEGQHAGEADQRQRATGDIAELGGTAVLAPFAAPAVLGRSGLAAGLIAAGLVTAGLIAASLIAAGLVTASLVTARLVAAGLVAAGLVTARFVAVVL
ncbi:hypothetical protein HWV07_10280 [Natronomonas salina]|nr:hypothetical protein HWV07_10280 [Natronomonas salina]